jgi:hypothetical protein
MVASPNHHNKCRYMQPTKKHKKVSEFVKNLVGASC